MEQFWLSICGNIWEAVVKIFGTQLDVLKPIFIIPCSSVTFPIPPLYLPWPITLGVPPFLVAIVLNFFGIKVTRSKKSTKKKNKHRYI
jgi:hypothetical protein